MVSARSVLNGVIGDYLVETGNELATPMTLMRRPDQPVDLGDLVQELQRKQQQQREEESHDRLPLFILIHGLVSDEHCWGFVSDDGERVDYGSLLERDIPHSTSLHLRYNTGLHVSTNGQQLSHILQALMSRIPTEVDLSFVCHSMGGLIARSATQYALRQDSTTWIHSTRRIVFLGTPHQGSYWECAGNMLTCALDSIRCTRLAARLAKLRSPGIKDLRYGYTLDEDWKGPPSPQDQDGWLTNTRQPGRERLLEWVAYHTVTGTVMSDPKHPLSLLLGDGLVSRASAQGKSTEPGYALPFPSTREFPGIHHNALQCSAEVYVHLREWILATPPPERDLPAMDWTVLPCQPTTNRIVWNDRMEPQCTDGGFVLLEADPHDNNHQAIIHHAVMDPNIILETPKDKVARFAPYRGATALVQDVINAGVTAVEQIQTEWTDDVYRVVRYVTPSLARPIVAGVHGIHTGLVSTVYSSIRGVNNGTAETVKCALQTLDTVEWMRWRLSTYMGYSRPHHESQHTLKAVN